MTPKPDVAADPPWVGPDGQRVERLELHLSYACPNHCWFCSEDHRMERFREFPVSYPRVVAVLRRHVERGVNSVLLTGGEPTIHPRFVDILVVARKLALRTSTSTNSIMLSREPFARQVLPLLDECMFSLHGPTAAVHEDMTRRAGSFDQVVQAARLARVVMPDLAVCVNIVLTRRNADHLGDTVALAVDLGASLIVVSNVSPEGRGLDHYAELAVPLAELAERLPAVVDRAGDRILRFFGVPLCLLGPHAMLSNDLHWDPRVTVEWTSRPGKVVLEDVYTWTAGRERAYVEACQSCLQRGNCRGVFARYRELFSTDALRPIVREVV